MSALEAKLVSIIIPTYNRDYCICDCVNSVLNQTYKNIEVIIVDDGSTDKTQAVIKNKYGNNDRVVYCWQDNQGVSKARNTGIDNSNGEYIAFLDSDDLWLRDKLFLQIQCLENLNDVGMIWSNMSAIDGKGNILSNLYLREMYDAYAYFKLDNIFQEKYHLIDIVKDVNEEYKNAIIYAGSIFSNMIMGNLVHTSTVLLKRERLNKVKHFNEELKYSGEDYDFHLRTCREGKVALLDIPTIKYRIGEDDQLTSEKYGVYLAQNYLNTVMPIIENDREEINLPDNMIEEVVRNGYSWLGEMYFQNNRYKEARPCLIKSLKKKLFQPRLLKLLFITYFPDRIISIVRNIKNK